MTIKQLLSAVLAAAFCVTAAGCSKDGGSSAEITSGSAAESESSFNKDITAMELTSDIKVGWNLGNTLDATGGTGLYQETSWGNPTTTQELIQAVKDAGFNAVRVPVTWEKQMDENYTINAEFMARVKEVVDYAYGIGMYVIVNMHHEEWYQPYAENEEAISQRLKTCWSQIAATFKDYDEHLIFEGMNEPRWKNTPNEWNGGNDEGRTVVNHLNQAFVDAVRASGGNNEYRFLMVCPYAANSTEPALAALEIPDDDRVIVSVHAYIPYAFALASPGQSRWDKTRANSTRDIDTLAEVLDRLFISKGQAVIIGECGAMNRDNEEYRAEWAEYYFGKFKSLGIPCFWWDNGAFTSGETFGLFDRRTNEVKYPDLLAGMMRGVNGQTAEVGGEAA